MRFAVLLLMLGLSTPAFAQDLVVCVDPSGPGTSCVPEPCDLVVGTISGALDAAAGEVASRGGLGVQVCAGDLPVLSERLVVDNSSDQLGAPFSLNFVENEVCPGADDSPATAAIEWRAGSNDSLVGVTLDFRPDGSCPSERPGVDVLGDGQLFLTGTFRGTSSYAIRSGVDSPDGRVEIRNTVVAECDGAAIDNAALIQVWNSHIVGCMTPAGALLRTQGGDGVEIRNSLVAGNRVGPGAEGLAVGLFPVISNTAFVANSLGPSVPLLEAEPVLPRWDLDAGLLVNGSGNPIEHSTFSRNVAESDPLNSLDPSPPERPRPDDALPQSCIDTDYRSWLESLQRDSSTAESDLLRFSGGGSGAYVALFKNTFVANRTGGGALLQLDSLSAGVSVQIFQNTFGEMEGVPWIEYVGGGSSEVEVLVARNLLDGTQLDAASESRSFRVHLTSHNAGGDTPEGWSGDVASIRGRELSTPSFLASNEVLDSDSCGRHLLHCTDHDVDDCADLAPRGALFCPVDRGADYVPAISSAVGPAAAWAGPEEFFEGGEGWTVPGATGWRCEGLRPSVDSIPGLGFGDGDGVPDLIDCDNDDTSAGSWPDDSDAADWCDDEETGEPQDVAPNGETVPVGCTGRGCGVALGPLQILLLLWIPAFARRKLRWDD